tara:strand:- start:1411 stop:1956 length:546 start_codon:yes stop_codon:yes gene_type:complete
MKTFDAITQRRTIHFFKSGKVPNSIIKNSLVAANSAPCHKATYPWRFNIIRSKTRKLLFEEYYRIKYENKSNDQKKLELEKKYFNPSNLIIVTQILNKCTTRSKEDYAACCCAIENLMVYLRSENIYSKWTTGKTTDSEKIYKIVGIDSDIEKIIGFIWIGYGDKPKDLERPNVELFIRYK